MTMNTNHPTFVIPLDETSLFPLEEFKDIEREILGENKIFTGRFDYFLGMDPCGGERKHTIKEGRIIRDFKGSDFIIFRHNGPINGDHKEGMETYAVDKIVGGIFPNVDMTETYLRRLAA